MSAESMRDGQANHPQDDSLARYREAAERLMQAVDRGDQGEADAVVDELTHLRETELFQQLGQLTRDLHEAIKSFKLDTRLSDIAATEIPDARERLNYVITMTEQAAHRTLGIIEESMPLTDELRDQSAELAERWRAFRRRELSAEEFRELSRDIDGFLGRARLSASDLHNKLSEALMAQDYQDITGQVIRRVIGLVEEVEENLVQMVALSGKARGEESRKTADKGKENKETDMRGEGPQMPSKGEDVVKGQDDVDDLLSSLGF